MINAGIYRIHRDAFARYRPGQTFSLEADVIQDLATQGRLVAAVASGTLTDIGVPKDYFRYCERFDGYLQAIELT